MKIKTCDFVKSATKVSQFPEEKRNEFVFLGRSNVGKSSFINMLLNRKALAKTSSNPGKTQLLNIFSVNDDIYFVDVPGYGYANVDKVKIQEFGKMVEGYLKESEHLKCAFILVDGRHGPTKDDCLMYDYLKYYEIPTTIIATKMDQVSVNKQEASRKLIKETLNYDKNDRIVLTSVKTKKGLEESYEIIDSYMEEK